MPDRDPDQETRVFVSYARVDKSHVATLTEGLRSLGAYAWLDESLVGGHEWWDEILRQIRRCDVFVQAISTAGIESEACTREREYARALGKPTLPVLVDAVDTDWLPDDLARLQIVKYVNPTSDDALRLARALANCPPAPELPDPLPAPPEVPVSYVHGLREQVRGPLPTLGDQLALIARLEDALEDADDRDLALSLLERLGERDDLYEVAARRIDRLIGDGDTELGPTPERQGMRPAAVAGYVVLAAALAALAGGLLREATRPDDGAGDATEVIALVFSRAIGWALIVAAVSALLARPATSGRPSAAALRGLLAGAVAGLAGGLVHGVLQYGADVDSGVSRLIGLAITGALAGAHLGRWLRAPAGGFTGGLVGGLAAGLIVLNWPGPDAPEAVSALSWIAHAVPVCAGALGLAALVRRRPAPLADPAGPVSTALKT